MNELNLTEILPFVIPIYLIHIILVVVSIVNLVKRKKVRFNNKILWGIIIIFVQIIGPVLYLLFRGEDEG